MKNADAITKFCAYLLTEKRVSPNTYIAYKQDLAQFGKFMEQEKFTVESAETSDLKRFLKYLHDQHLSARSIARKIAALKGLFSYLSVRHDIPDVARTLTVPKIKKSLPEYLSEEEMELLFATAEKDQSPPGRRNLMMLYIMYVTGMRVSELVHLKVGDVHFDTGCICIMGKGGKQRLVPLPQQMCEMIRDYLAHTRESLCGAGDTDYLFPSVYGKVARALSRQAFWTLLKGIWRKAGITRPISPHKLRHSFATHMLKKGVNLRSLQLLLGHENISTVQWYTHVETTYLRSIYDKKHPRS